MSFIIALVIYLLLSLRLTYGPDFNDESEKYIVTLLIKNGRHLYSQIFVQHGPVSYMLSHILYLIHPYKTISTERLIPVILSLCTIAAVMASPLLTRIDGRLIAGTILIVAYACLQSMFNLVMAIYQIFAGQFYLIALVLFVLPFVTSAPLKRWHAIIGGLCLAMVFYCAISFSIALFFVAILCALAFLIHPTRYNFLLLLNALLGGVSSTVIVFLWLYKYGSIKGYWVSHFYYNLNVYSAYVKFSPLNALHLFIPGYTWLVLPKYWYTHFLFMLPEIYAALFACVAYKRKILGDLIYRYFVLFFLLMLCMVYMSPRLSVDFAASTYVIVCLGFMAVTTALIFEQRDFLPPALTKTNIIALGFIGIMTIISQFTVRTWLYDFSPIDYYRHTGVLGSENDIGMNFVRSIVPEGEPVEQFPFNLNFYVGADRLPAFQVFYWLPPLNDYAKHPLSGFVFDNCLDMKTAPPKVVFYTPVPIGDYTPESFMSCEIDIIQKKYLKTTKMKDLWVRADIVADNPDALQAAVVQEDYDTSWLPADERQRIENAKISYRVLSTANGLCLRQPGDGHQPLSVIGCDDKRALKMALHHTGKHIEMLIEPDNECIEVTDSAKNTGAPLRSWPCTGTLNQAAAVLPSKTGFRLRFVDSGLCLSSRRNSATQIDCQEADEWHFLP